MWCSHYELHEKIGQVKETSSAYSLATLQTQNSVWTCSPVLPVAPQQVHQDLKCKTSYVKCLLSSKQKQSHNTCTMQTRFITSHSFFLAPPTHSGYLCNGINCSQSFKQESWYLPPSLVPRGRLSRNWPAKLLRNGNSSSTVTVKTSLPDTKHSNSFKRRGLWVLDASSLCLPNGKLCIESSTTRECQWQRA